MQLLRGVHHLNGCFPQGCVATIGNFDGFHRGHQAVIQRLKTCAQERNLPEMVILFEPHPKEYFATKLQTEPPARLYRLRDKLTALRQHQVHTVCCLRFDEALATQPPAEFITELLLNRLNVHHLIVGDDFRFGYKRQGDFALLQRYGASHGFGVEDLPTLMYQGERISSTRTRAALGAGDLNTTAGLLGRPYRISGRVCHGAALGRTIGFPTANVNLLRTRSPVAGVFAVRVHGLAPTALPGVANVGNRPTVDGRVHRLEIHLFDFDQDIYGRSLEVELVQQLRQEQKFADFEHLKQQIARDAAQARHILDIPAKG